MKKLLCAAVCVVVATVYGGGSADFSGGPEVDKTEVIPRVGKKQAMPISAVGTGKAALPAAAENTPKKSDEPAPDAAEIKTPDNTASAAPDTAALGSTGPVDAKVEFYDTVLASVDGEPIVLSEVVLESQQEEARLFAMLTGQKLEDAVVAQRRKVVNNLIDRRLLRKEFKPDEYKLDNQVIESLIDDWAATLNCKTRIDLERWARRNRTTIPEMRRKVVDYLIEQYVLFRQFAIEVNVTPRETYEFFQAHEAEYAQREALHLRALYLDGSRGDLNERSERVGAMLAAEPGRFAEFAAEYTDGPFRANSGDLGWLERGQLRTLFADAVGAVPEVGKPIGPVQAPEGCYFLLVEELKPAAEPDYAALERSIRERLENERRTAAYDEYLKKLREKAVIRYY